MSVDGYEPGCRRAFGGAAQAPAHDAAPHRRARDPRDRRSRRPPRLGHPELAQPPVGHDQRDLARVPPWRRRAEDAADNGYGVRLVRDPSLRVSDDALPARARLLCGVGCAQRDPAGETRYVCAAPYVLDYHRPRDLIWVPEYSCYITI